MAINIGTVIQPATIADDFCSYAQCLGIVGVEPVLENDTVMMCVYSDQNEFMDPAKTDVFSLIFVNMGGDPNAFGDYFIVNAAGEYYLLKQNTLDRYAINAKNRKYLFSSSKRNMVLSVSCMQPKIPEAKIIMINEAIKRYRPEKDGKSS